jgi:hypothetical protein
VGLSVYSLRRADSANIFEIVGTEQEKLAARAQIERYVDSSFTSDWTPFSVQPDPDYEHLETPSVGFLSSSTLVISKSEVMKLGQSAFPGVRLMPLSSIDRVLGVVGGYRDAICAESSARGGYRQTSLVDFDPDEIPLEKLFSVWWNSRTPQGLFFATDQEGLPVLLEMFRDGTLTGVEVSRCWSSDAGPIPIKL